MVEELQRFKGYGHFRLLSHILPSVHEKGHLIVRLAWFCMQTFIKIYHMIEDLRRFPYFRIFGLGVTLVKEKWHLASPFATTCRYLSVGQTFSKCTQRFKCYWHFPNWLRTNRRTHKMIHKVLVNLSIGRIGQIFCGSCNKPFLTYHCAAFKDSLQL